LHFVANPRLRLFAPWLSFGSLGGFAFMSWQLALFLFIAIVAFIVGIVRWLGAPRWLAFSIPIAPLLVWMIYTLVTHEGYADEGGGMAVWVFVAMLLLIALPVSTITVFIVPKRHGKPSA
jgi:hypothetical protein